MAQAQPTRTERMEIRKFAIDQANRLGETFGSQNIDALLEEAARIEEFIVEGPKKESNDG